MKRSAVIVGAGIGGLSAARAMAMAGWDVSVYERAPVLEPVGAGIGIAPNAVKALDRLGLAGALRARGRRQNGLAIRLLAGRTVMTLPGVEVEERFGEGFYALHRAELHAILLDSLEPGVLRTGHRATAISQDSTSATVSFDTPEGSVTATADLVIAADGVHSSLRARLFPDYPGAAYAGYTVWRGIVPAEEVDRIGVEAVLAETWGRGARFGIAPINDGQVYWFACESMPADAEPVHDLGALAARFASWHDPIPRLLAATPASTLLRHDVYYLKDPLPSFVRGRAVLLGDAAHAVTPDIGQGACLSIEDAVVLAAELSTADTDAGLSAYESARHGRTEKLAISSGRIGGILQTSNPVSAAVRDTVARILPTSVFLRFAGGALAWSPPRL